MMTNKSISIKNASDKELDDLLMRLRKEREAQSIIAELIRNSTDPDKRRYDYYVPVSTEEPIDNLYHNNKKDDDYLAHYGVLGMRWGVRRKRENDLKKYNEGSDDYKKRVQTKAKPIHKMTNAELKALNERLNLEKQYRELSKIDMSRGRRVVGDILANAGKETMKNALVKVMSKGTDAILEKILKDDKKKKTVK